MAGQATRDGTTQPRHKQHKTPKTTNKPQNKGAKMTNVTWNVTWDTMWNSLGMQQVPIWFEGDPHVRWRWKVFARTFFFCWKLHGSTKFVVRAVAFCQLIEVKKGSSKMMMYSISSALKQQKLKKHRTNRGKERRQPHRGCLKQQHSGKPASTIWSRDILARQLAGDRDHACQMVQSGFVVACWRDLNRTWKKTTPVELQSCWIIPYWLQTIANLKLEGFRPDRTHLH